MQIKKYLPVLEYVASLSRKKQKEFITHADGNFLKIISEICYNINKGNLDLTGSQIKKLRPFRRDIEFLCKKSRSNTQRRHKLQKGGLIFNILSEVLPLVISALFPNLSS